MSTGSERLLFSGKGVKAGFAQTYAQKNRAPLAKKAGPPGSQKYVDPRTQRKRKEIKVMAGQAGGMRAHMCVHQAEPQANGRTSTVVEN